MRIGLLGTPTRNNNLGCMALTYSLFKVLNTISEKQNIDFEYIIFDWHDDPDSIEQIKQKLKIASLNITFCKLALISDPLRNIKHFFGIAHMKRMLQQCDCIIDMTEGDSFSDIYGNHMFRGRTNIKSFIEKKNIPFMLGPQTYGPFVSENNKELARKVIQNADIILVRDLISQKLIQDMTGRQAIYTTDLAFMLPYERPMRADTETKIKVGINVSDLLWAGGNEVQNRNFTLMTNYKEYMTEIIRLLLQSGKYEIHMIPHVRGDEVPHNELKRIFPEIIIEGPFYDPITAKSFISSMDIFIGARMHGTIAAFTAGIACIPVAYSIKFQSLFQSNHYPYVVDLQKMGNDQAVRTMMEYIGQYLKISQEAIQCRKIYTEYVTKIETTLSDWLISIENR